jgi:uncharacterized membrane protein
MNFAISLPWWALLLVGLAIGAAAWGSYMGAIVPLPTHRRVVLASLRAATLLLLVICVLRPVRVVPPDTATDAVVPILVDASRSMRVADMDGRTRISVAEELLGQVRSGLAGRLASEVWTFGNALEQSAGGAVSADAGRSDLSGALRTLRDRYRERRVAAIVVVSDGGDTGLQDAAAALDSGAAPIYALGVGAPRASLDLEVLDVSIGEAALADSSVDLSVAAVNRGGTEAFDLRVLENGRTVDIRRVAPAADGSPVREVFTVSPARDTPTLYTVEIPSGARESVLENNRRTVLVEPPGRRRRILMIEGAPGFEHSFIQRALISDAGIELDSVVRKGLDAQGAATYFVQAGEARAPRLAFGFPREREALFAYDALVLANVAPDALSQPQLQMLADFVDRRGGGLLVAGARSFEGQGYAGTVLEDVLPLRLTDPGSGVVTVAARPGARFTVTLTPDGRSHPVMRIGGGPAELMARWAAVPPLSGAAALGGLRPGARTLALVQTPDGARPLVAVQRYGQGRSLVFTGEASWRWRMQMPSADRTHELFWRQAARWVASGSPDPVSITAPDAPVPGGPAVIAVDVRGDDFEPKNHAPVTLQVTAPGGGTQQAHAILADTQTGRYSADVRVAEPGVYRVAATVGRDGAPPTRAERWFLVGGADLEMADPRLNEDVLRRVATASGGRYLPARDAAQLASLLASVESEPSAPTLRELWHNAWIFAGVMMLLAAEWTLRRRWGLR